MSLGLSTVTKLKVVAYVIIGLANMIFALYVLSILINPPILGLRPDGLVVAIVVVFTLTGVTFFYSAIQFIRKEKRASSYSQEVN